MATKMLTHYGYHVKIASISKETLASVINELTVHPFKQDMLPQDVENSKFSVYRYTKDKQYIIVPRYYGINKFGKPDTTVFDEEDIEVNFTKTLRSNQQKISDHCISYLKKFGGGLLSVPCGFGKCLSPDTKILMFDGTLKRASCIIIGDTLMGDDSSPRTVVSVAQGEDEMFRVRDAETNEFYDANKAHILCLKTSSGQIIDISIDQYLQLDSQTKKTLRGYRTAVEFKLKPHNLACMNMLTCKPANLAQLKYFTRFDKKLRTILLNKAFENKNNKQIVTSDKKYANLLKFLGRSLGYAVTASLNGNEYILRFVKPKRPKTGLSYEISVTQLSRGFYCGFEITGNGRFVLGDFTVTHNTVCALYIAKQLSLKTLVVVHKSFLLNQWTERAVEFLGISKKDVGIIRQKKCNVDNKHLVIGMIQTIAKKHYDGIFNRFGLVIYDEAHHVPCKFFSKALMKTGATYTLALTATPYRLDGLIKVMYWFCGGTIYQEKIKVNTNVVAKMINFRSKDVSKFSLKKKWTNGEMRPDTVRMTTDLCQIAARNKMIVNLIDHIRKTEPDRKILVLSGRIFHLGYLKSETDKLIKKDIDAGILDEDEIFTCFYTGSTNVKLRQEAEEKGDIIFATYDMAHEGLDIKHMNTVILASPKKNIVQSIGRIMRTILKAGDIKPLIIDICDELDSMRGWTKQRMAVYKQCKYVLESYYLIDENFVTRDTFDGTDDKDEINKYAKIHLNEVYKLNKDIKIFRELCAHFENKDKNEITNLPNEQNLDGIKFEFTEIDDIINVARLTENDFEHSVICNGTDKFDLDRDIKLGQDQCDLSQDQDDAKMFDKKSNNRTSMFFRPKLKM